MGMHVPSPMEEGELPPCSCFVLPPSSGRDRRGEFAAVVVAVLPKTQLNRVPSGCLLASTAQHRAMCNVTWARH